MSIPAELAKYYDPMDPGFPDRGSEADVTRYLQSKADKGELNPEASRQLITELQAKLEAYEKPAVKSYSDHEYALVFDRTSEILNVNSDYVAIKKLAGVVRKAGGEVTIFKAIKG